jgi:hypothetical protein
MQSNIATASLAIIYRYLLLFPCFLWHIPINPPTPDIQPNLTPLGNRQPGMPTLTIPRPITPHILPKHGISRYRLENNTLAKILFPPLIRWLGIAFNKPTPTSINRFLQTRKMCTTARTVCCYIYHETTYAAAGFTRAAPVVVVCVVAAYTVALGPEFFNEGVRLPALD